ncbi:hypothetical protein A3B02_00125 [Candidatus Roizmanbacteria bacterium RIFCSPLOWO2_01_FULL_42_14]|uniref:PDZ domain-containing protein n=3 Tax=Candidatus Roizmaniibacteriota TaxID=1752723 RepID=A0A1F7JTG5_9BACT|nr:MAG: hypothetical protein A3F32_01950 [Candidatus Roizmanbacteria bacterium RIFCSPHIGHO2_12_FULL_42_10]OGK52051.1 MAG: hypothetical protein A3B02_00125 [Candidatus Roizmanbacteria bacterium RIFCSPLOWO2_01_FULL_42_14]OGK58905.1 MAG: hypothetical protein A3I56_04625 [Candidatus Roizmanbacteria bacterium RIFCSPLOWO2_02_FULL_43_10]
MDTEGKNQEKRSLKLKQITDKIIVIAVLVAVFGSGYRLGEKRFLNTPKTPSFSYSTQNLDTRNTRNLDFKLFWEAWNALEDKYVDKKKLDPQTLYYGAIKGMIASVGDSYTFFLTPEENKESKKDLEGKFFGIGAELGLKSGQIVVVTPLKESPAQKAGIRAGDAIMKINGESTRSVTLFDAVNKIRGKKDTIVTLTILRADMDKTIDIKVKRDEINIPFVESIYEDDVAIVTLSRFGDPTNALWDKIVQDIAAKRSKGKVKGMVLDVRGNPGGYLQSAVHIASEFVPDKTVLVKQEYADQDPDIYTADHHGKLIGLPVVVLLNAGSASASEIVAGALRDTISAKLVGENSFGKGTVQTADDLSSGAGIHITISKWILPKGSWIHETGLKPDITVENKLENGNTLTRETDEQMNKAVETLRKIISQKG